MTRSKCIKDPVYGYIKFEKDTFEKIIDKPMFQRLRRIEQAGYAALFPSSTHNRFVHSLGVFHLARLMIKTLQKAKEFQTQERKSQFKILGLAALLHDVGHAPFSHSTEDYYLGPKNDYSTLHKRLAAAISSDQTVVKSLMNEFNNRCKTDGAAKPHEIMSAIVGIKEFLSKYPDFDNDISRSFFARAICGYRYSSKCCLRYKHAGKSDHSFSNCLITILNSSVLDVDKLDYLLRDSYLLGFDTVRVDYHRLVGSIMLLRTGDHGGYEIVFGKNAVSVLENVVYARDAERKWLQGHPIVQLEADILRDAIDAVLKEQRIDGQEFFSYESLSEQGHQIKAGLVVRLLSDVDVLYLLKQSTSSKAKLYFDRSAWPKPLWKSEFEYRAIFRSGAVGPETMDKIYTALDDLCAYIENQDKYEGYLDDKILEAMHRKLKTIKRRKDKDIHKEHLEVLKLLKYAADKMDEKFCFRIIRSREFKSGFSNDDLSEIKVRLNDKSMPVRFGDVDSTLTPRKTMAGHPFYLYSERKIMKNSDAAKILSAELCSYFVKNYC